MNPPAGPLDVAPDVTPDGAKDMLDEALDGIVFGPYDQEVLAYVGFADAGYGAAIASWLRRCWEAGLEAGRAERVEEAAVGEACEDCGATQHRVEQANPTHPDTMVLCAACAKKEDGS